MRRLSGQKISRPYLGLRPSIKHHKSSAFALVRGRARAVAKKLGMTCCKACGSDKHFEVAHIKAISSFPDTTLVSEVNAARKSSSVVSKLPLGV